MLHCNTFVPKPKLVTAVFGAFGDVIVPLPLTTDQVPTPVVGVLPAKVVVGFKIQRV